METLITTVYLAGMLVAPVTGYLLAARRPDARRLDLFRGATLGGAALGGILAPLALVHLLASTGPTAVGLQIEIVLYFLVTCTVAGAVIGALGLIARALGAWLGRRV